MYIWTDSLRTVDIGCTRWNVSIENCCLIVKFNSFNDYFWLDLKESAIIAGIADIQNWIEKNSFATFFE